VEGPDVGLDFGQFGAKELLRREAGDELAFLEKRDLIA
jgi:hypothetical protein